MCLRRAQSVEIEQAGLAGGLAGGARRAPAFCEARVPEAMPRARFKKVRLPGDGPRVGARSNPAPRLSPQQSRDKRPARLIGDACGLWLL